jgi:hypothetical protein
VTLKDTFGGSAADHPSRRQDRGAVRGPVFASSVQAWREVPSNGEARGDRASSSAGRPAERDYERAGGNTLCP